MSGQGQERELEEAYERAVGVPWINASVSERACFRYGYRAALAAREEPQHVTDEMIERGTEALLERLPGGREERHRLRGRAREKARIVLEAVARGPEISIAEVQAAQFGGLNPADAAAREDTERPDLRGQLEAAGLTDSEIDAVVGRAAEIRREDTERPDGEPEEDEDAERDRVEAEGQAREERGYR